MTDTVEVTLKPCPFCGGRPSAPTDEGYGYWVIACRGADCLVDPCADGNTEAEAIAAWNTRREVTRELVEALRPFAKAGELFVGPHYDNETRASFGIYRPVKGPDWDVSAQDLFNAYQALAKHRDATQ